MQVLFIWSIGIKVVVTFFWIQKAFFVYNKQPVFLILFFPFFLGDSLHLNIDLTSSKAQKLQESHDLHLLQNMLPIKGQLCIYKTDLF